MMRTDNPIRDYAQYDYEQSLLEQACPICEDCGNHITGEYYWEFHGFYYCEDCVRSHRYDVEDYINGNI